MAIFRYCFCLIAYIPVVLFAQAPELHFENISSKENLSHNTVISLLRDSDGFLWIATMDGLNRYDGYTCKVYRHEPGDSASLSVNFLHNLFEDSKGYLWIATRDGGLNKFDRYTEKFTHYRHNPEDVSSISSDKVNDLLEDNKGNLWLATEAGLNHFNPETEVFTHYFHNPDDPGSLSHSWLNSLIMDSEGFIWISSLKGLNKFDPRTGKNLRFYKGNNARSLNRNATTAIYEDDEGMIWVGTAGGGLHSYDKKSNSFTRYHHEMVRDLGSVPVNINSIVSFDSQHLLIATEGYGLLLFDKVKKRFTSWIHEPENSSSLSSNIVNVILKDHQDIIWLGTWGGGVDKLTKQNNSFVLINNFSEKGTPASSGSVFSIVKDKDDVVWFGTKAKSLNRYDRKTDTFTTIKLPSGESTSPSGVGALHLDSSGDLWIGYDGLLRYRQPGTFDHFQYDPQNENSISGNDIKCIVEDKDHNLWIGTEDGGASKFDKNTNQWTRYFSKRENPLLVRSILADSDGFIWFGTYKNGIIRMNPQSGDTVNYIFNGHSSSLSNNDIRHIIETTDKEVWVATYGGGINKFNKEKGDFTAITEADGLSNNFTYGILEDENGILWISTNYGITRYNPSDNSFKVYTEDDGLQNNEFNTGAFFKGDDGELFFGGVDGFNSFYPEKLKTNDYLPPVFITSFKVFDKEVRLDTSITYQSDLMLEYSDKFFSFEFAALDFTNPTRSRYAYMLEGFDEGWIQSSSRRFASYTNLDPGKYTLRIKASNPDGVWNEEGLTLGIIVTPPYWQTTWFRSLVTLLLLGIIIATVRYYSTRRLKKQIMVLEREQMVQKERERISRDLHDNVGAHLTFLISSIDNLAYSKNDALSDRIGEISSYGRKTIKELRNTIWAMKYDEADLNELILKFNELKQEVNSSFGPGFLDIKNYIKKPMKLSVARALNIYRIVQEAVQNAIKYANATSLVVSFSEQPESIELKIKDNGNGFDTHIPSEGNGLANMKNRCEEVEGQFNIESGSEGTTITCTFKK